MAVNFDTSLLLGYYRARYSPNAAGGAATAGGGRPKYAPTAPWATQSTYLRSDALVKNAMLGRKLIDEQAAQLDLKGASEDYRKLFALYQGLNALYGMTEKAGARGTSSLDLLRLTTVFNRGIAEVGAYADSLKLDQLRLTRGEAMTTAKSSGVPKAISGYVTGTVHTGAATDEVASLQGPAAFDIKIVKMGVTTNISIDLAEMGAAPRTMGAVTNFINSKLEAQGVNTRFAVQRTKAEPRVIQVGGKSVTLPATGDAFAFKINGESTERATFQAVSRPAVYVTTLAGNPDPDNDSKTADGVFENRLIKIDPAAAVGPDTRIKTETLEGTVKTVRTSKVDADGFLYMLADVEKSIEGQAVKGDTDVALLKYDSAGNLVFARTLGAASKASGLALAISADGKIAVAGSVTGQLEGAVNGPINSNAASGKTDSLVTLYDAKGDEIWTMRRGALEEDEATGVAFGADGVVYVTGRTKSAMPGGGGASGGYDGYLTAYATTDKNVPKTLFTQQFGTTADDKPAGIVVDGGKVTVASSEDGRAVLRSFDTTLDTTRIIRTTSDGVLTTTIETYTNGALSGSESNMLTTGGPDSTSIIEYTHGGTLTAGATRDLGDLLGGSVAGLALSDGALWVAGQTRNGALAAGAASNAHAGGMDAFAIRLSTDLGNTSADALAYYGGAGDNTVAAMTVAGGKVYVVGQAGADLPGLSNIGTKEGYLAAIDVATGAISGAQRITGKDGIATATSVAVDLNGASSLDKFGLPIGTLDYTASQKVVAATAARAGDQFQIRTRAGGAALTITIEANDTLETLAAKIRRKGGYQVKVEVASAGDNRILRITPGNNNSTVEILPGKGGNDALEALGLAEGIIRNTKVIDGKTKTTAPGGEIYGLGLKLDISLADKDAIKQAQAVLNNALAKIRTMYRDLETAAKPPSLTNNAVSGPVPAYLQAQLANYQAGLARLTGGG